MRKIPLCALLTVFCAAAPSAFAQDNPFSSLFSSGTKTKVTSGKSSPGINEVQAESYNGPKARIAISRFTDKTRSGWYSRRLGDGMADQMATALFNSNRFIVLERRQIKDVLKEQNFGASGRVRKDTAAAIGEIEGAELIITGAVTEFERGTSGRSGSIGGGRSTGGILGSIVGSVAGSTRRSHIAIDVRIIDTRTSRIVAATSVEGTATDVNLGGALSRYTGRSAFRGALSGWEKEPIGKALRIAINSAVNFIASKTPPQYYRAGQATSASRAASKSSSAASSGGDDIEARLVRLKKLHKQGLISKKEYNAKKKRLLDQL